MKLPVLRDASSSLPRLQARWIASILPGPLPDEPLATCGDCAMVLPAGERGGFLADVKCCTYFPQLPNHLAGAALADDAPAGAAGRAALRARIAQRVGVTPLGVGPPSHVRDLADPRHERFGRSLALRCPYYVVGEGACGIWRHRTGVCSSWYCKHARGAAGAGLWVALERLWSGAEDALARWCALDAGLGDDALAALTERPGDPAGTRGDPDGVVDEARYRRLWGPWRGREEAFYREAAARVEGLAWDDVLRVGGVELALRARLVERAWRRATAEGLPERLRAGTFQVAELRGETARVVSYSPHHPLELPVELLALLGRFDGEPTAATLRAIEADAGIELEPELLQTLVDHELLVPAEDEGGREGA